MNTNINNDTPKTAFDETVDEKIEKFKKELQGNDLDDVFIDAFFSHDKKMEKLKQNLKNGTNR